MGRETARPSFLQEMAVASRKVRNVFDARAREHGMTFARARLLLYLASRPAPTQGELAEALEVERPTMARLIDGMEKAGLVVREGVDGDRRLRRILLTAAAESQVDEVLRLTDRLRADALAGIAPADLVVAQRVVEQILANLTAD